MSHVDTEEPPSVIPPRFVLRGEPGRVRNTAWLAKKEKLEGGDSIALELTVHPTSAVMEQNDYVPCGARLQFFVIFALYGDKLIPRDYVPAIAGLFFIVIIQKVYTTSVWGLLKPEFKSFCVCVVITLLWLITESFLLWVASATYGGIFDAAGHIIHDNYLMQIDEFMVISI